MGQMTVGGAIGIKNKSTMLPIPVPAGTPAPSGSATMMLDVIWGLILPIAECFGHTAAMEGIRAIDGTPAAFNRAAPGAEFVPTRRH